MTRNLSLPRQVYARDCGVCQACFLFTTAPEAHHLKAFVDGGDDRVDNMVTLCRRCHKHVPSDPSKFLDYQRQGGYTWVEGRKYAWDRMSEQCPDLTRSSFLKAYTEFRMGMMLSSMEYRLSVQDGNLSRAAEIEEDIRRRYASLSRDRRKLFDDSMPPLDCILCGF